MSIVLNPSIVPEEEETALGKGRILWAHLRLAHEDIEGLSYCLLSVFPFLGAMIGFSFSSIVS